MSKQLIVKGHTLPNEGRVMGDHGLGNSEGSAKCSCGEQSPTALPSTGARQRWHRDHKQAVLDATGAEKAKREQRMRAAAKENASW